MVAARVVCALVMVHVGIALFGTQSFASDGRVEGGRRVDLAITGTKIELSPLGLPKSLEGLLFYRGGPNDGVIAGTYEERVTPQIDSTLGLVGSTGKAVFRFLKRNGGALSSENIVTVQRSKVVGEVPEGGELLVESSGRIAAGTGEFAGVAGRMASRSRIRLAGGFQLSVELSLILTASGATIEAQVHRALPRWRSVGLADSSCLLTVGESGEASLLYSTAFKRRLVGRLIGTPAVEASALAKSTGLSEKILDRWAREGRQVSALSKVLPVPAVFKQPRTFEERLGVVLRAATFSDEALDEFLTEEGVSMEEVVEWRRAIELAIEQDGAGETDRAAGSDESQGLEALKEKIDALFGAAMGEGGSGESN